MMRPQPPVIAEIHASAPRRYFALAVLACLAACLIYLAMAYPPAGIGWQIFLLAMAAGTIWLLNALYHASAKGLVLTADDLRTSDGETLVNVTDILSVERGTFAFKPSNGFTLRTNVPAPRRWAPGMWWRMGRRIGVGGITGASQAKAMAEAIAIMLAKQKED